MRKILISIIFIAFGVNLAFAQNKEQSEQDTSFFKFGGTKILFITDTTYVPKEKFSGHFASLSFGINSFIQGESSEYFDAKALELNLGRSWEFNADAFDISFNLYKQHFGVLTGLGFKFQNYRLANNYLIYNDKEHTYSELDTVTNYTKSKLAINSVRVPVLFEWQNTYGRKHREIYFSAGMTFSYRMVSFMKYNYKIDGEKRKDKKFADYHLNPFQYTILAKLGIGEFEFYFEYNLSKMFKSGEGIDANQFSVGLILLDL